MVPRENLYSKEHEWVRVEDDVATIGITDFAQGELGEVVFVELPEIGSAVTADEEIGTIESVKAVAEVFTPVSGEVVAVNEALLDKPEMLNDDPHGEGWLVRVRMSSSGELENLMSAEAYERLIAGGEA